MIQLQHLNLKFSQLLSLLYFTAGKALVLCRSTSKIVIEMKYQLPW